jgi:hypothetical protein
MKRKFLVAGLAFASIAMIALPYLALADHNAIKSNPFDPTILAGPLVVCIGTAGGNIPPCNNLCDLIAQIANVIYFMMAVVIWIIAPITITIAGIRIMMAGGNIAAPTKENPGELSAAKKMITGAVVGIVIVLCAWLIVKTFVTAMGINGIGGFSSNTPACQISS